MGACVGRLRDGTAVGGRADGPDLRCLPGPRRLRRAAALRGQALDRFAQQLAGTRVGLVLADADGRVVGRWAPDSSALRTLARVSIEEGYVLAEDLAGTNRIGTALEVLAPVTMFGAEHHAEPLQNLVCAGVPIRHPLTRRIEGVLDLACPADDANGLLMIDGEPGSGRLFAARRIRQLRTPGTTLAIHLAGLAQLRGTPAWLAELARLLADQNVTVAVTNLELLDESAVCCWPRPGPAAAPRSGPSTWAPRSPRARAGAKL
jgi:hypothetical protein